MSADYASSATDRVPAGGSGVALSRPGGILVLVGLALGVASLWDPSDRVRLGFGYLWGFSFLWTVVLGSLFFVALQHLTGAVWSVVVRRVAEMFAAPMWLVAVLFVPIVLFGLLFDQFHLFPWVNAATVEHDHLLQGKQVYLNVPFFIGRAVVYFTLWIAFATYFVGTSLKLDRKQVGAEASVSMRKVAGPFILVFAVTMTFAGIDWIMSLEPHWFSTIFGVYMFSGIVVTALAAITMTTVKLREVGLLDPNVVTGDHLYSLGALLFAFVCFWAYIAFSQYMLIWYANLPEESFYLYHRLSGNWLGVSVALAVVRFAVPFFVLLSRRAKMNPTVLFWVSVFLLGGQLLDLYWLIMPELHKSGPLLGWQELGPPVMMIGVLVLYVSRFLRRHAALPVGDPMLDESRRFRL